MGLPFSVRGRPRGGDEVRVRRSGAGWSVWRVGPTYQIGRGVHGDVVRVLLLAGAMRIANEHRRNTVFEPGRDRRPVLIFLVAVRVGIVEQRSVECR